MEISNFEQLPNEILLKIFSNRSISAEDLISLSNVCQRFQNVCHSENKLWKSKFEQRWPSVRKNIVLWDMKTTQVENWKKEVEDSLKIRKILEVILKNLKYQTFKSQNLPWLILTSIYETINVGKFGHLIALNDIGEIIKKASETTDINQFHAQNILYFLNYHLLAQEMKQFLQLPPKRKTLEKRVFYLSKGLHPEAFLGYEYEEVSLKLDKLAHEVQSYLRTINPYHPAISVELFSPEEPLENSKWSDDESCELIKSINYILCVKPTMRKFDIIYHIFLHKRIEGHLVNHRYFTVIFIAVSHRLGIPLRTINFKNRILFKWKSSSFENGDIVYLYHFLNWNDLPEPTQNLICRIEYSIENFLRDFAYDSFYDSKREGDLDFFQDRVAAAGMILLLRLFPEDIFVWIYDDVIMFCLKNWLHLEAVFDTCDKLLSVNAENGWGYINKIKTFSAQAACLLRAQRKEPILIELKKRIQMIVIHILESPPRVIIE